MPKQHQYQIVEARWQIKLLRREDVGGLFICPWEPIGRQLNEEIEMPRRGTGDTYHASLHWYQQL